MAQGDFFTKTANEAASGNSLTISGAASSTGSVEIHTVASSGAVDVYTERDTTGDGTYDSTIAIQSSDSGIHSQKNKIEISSMYNMRLRIMNTGDKSIDIQVTGIEVSS